MDNLKTRLIGFLFAIFSVFLFCCVITVKIWKWGGYERYCDAPDIVQALDLTFSFAGLLGGILGFCYGMLVMIKGTFKPKIDN